MVSDKRDPSLPRPSASNILRAAPGRVVVLIWTLAAAAALLWPSRLAGPFDGIPLDTAAEAVVIGLIFPVLFVMHRRFLDTKFARVCVVALLAWKAVTAAAFVQGGLCVRMAPAKPFVKDGTGAAHSWDLRADWKSPDPVCSAIMTRSYEEFFEFPAWFFNLPPPNDSWPGPDDRPPGAKVGMTMSGFVNAGRGGVLRVVTGPDMAATLTAGSRSASGDDLARDGVRLDAGIQKILLDATLTGDRWQLVPTLNGTDVFASPITTIQRPSSFEMAMRPWISWVNGAIVIALAAVWLMSFLLRIGNVDLLSWATGASACIGLLAVTGDGSLARWAIAGLMGAALLRIPARRRNTLGGFALVGIPWLTFIAVVAAPQVGRYTLYSWGDDFWSFQRFAYRIVIQGYWLEGGSPTFWFQPLYRWIAGILHAVFGESSVGEWYWDGVCVLLMAMLSFQIVRRFAGFRWGVFGAALVLSVFTLGTSWGFLGRGLSEISSSGLMSAAALFALHSRHRSWRFAILAGIWGTLAFYTRLNNLPMVLGIAIFALPIRQPASTLFRPRTWFARVSWPTAAAMILTPAVGILLFAWRTWHYTGVFSVFYGTQRDTLSLWQPGTTLPALLERMAGSVMMVLTMNDPARFDPYALPLLAGAALSLLALVGVPWIRRLPLGPVVFCLSALAGALVARGTAYSGRFSIHAIAINCAVVACAAALMTRSGRRLRPATPT
jgi:hypothetical protein